jgi:hypothetical protein
MRQAERELKEKMEGSRIVVKKLCLFVLLVLVSFGAVKLLASGPPPPTPPPTPPSTNSVLTAPNQSFN